MQSRKLNIVAKIPVRQSNWETDDEDSLSYKEYKRFLQEITLLPTVLGFKAFINHSKDDKPLEKDISLSITKTKKRSEPILILSFNVYEFEMKYGKSSHVYLSNYIVKKISILSSLTYATSITFLPGFVYCNSSKSGKTDFMIHSFEDSYIDSVDYKWPTYEILSFEKVLSWLNKYQISLDTTSKNKASRAINAVSYLINDSNLEHSKSHLFWAMLGIEALYASGSSNILTQIKEKVNIVLGEPKEFKNRLSKLYNFRSRLVHGDIDFSSRLGEDDWDDFEKEYYDQVSFATSILLASIKKLIAKDLTEFNFEIVLKENLNSNLVNS